MVWPQRDVWISFPHGQSDFVVVDQGVVAGAEQDQVGKDWVVAPCPHGANESPPRVGRDQRMP